MLKTSLTMRPGNFLALLLLVVVCTAHTNTSPKAPIAVQGAFPGGTLNENDIILLGMEEGGGSACSENVKYRLSIIKGAMFPLHELGRKTIPANIQKISSSSDFNEYEYYLIVDLGILLPSNNVNPFGVLEIKMDSRSETNADRGGMIMVGTMRSNNASTIVGPSQVSQTTILPSHMMDGVYNPFGSSNSMPKILSRTPNVKKTLIIINMNETPPFVLNNTKIGISFSCEKGVGNTGDCETASRLYML